MSLVMLLAAACGPAGNRNPLSFENAWVRAIPPGMKMTAGYGELRNQGSEAIVVRTFTSDAFGDVSLHRTERENGVSRMREVPKLPLAAGETVVLGPGGLHLMFMVPSREIKEGVVIMVEMTAADGRSFRFEMPVERR